MSGFCLFFFMNAASKFTDAVETLRFFDDEDFTALFIEGLGEDDATSVITSGVDNNFLVQGMMHGRIKPCFRAMQPCLMNILPSQYDIELCLLRPYHHSRLVPRQSKS